MDVHQHSSSKGKKNWKSYFWEFLMLFLAVFCGFLAEYKLEHVIEHQREKKFIASLIEDVKSDTVLLTKTIAFNRARIKIVDTLLAELSGEKLFTDCRRAYDLSSESGFWNFESNDGTVQQLKSGGGLRIIRKQKIAANIMSYDKMVRVVNDNQNVFHQFMITLVDNNLKFFPTMTLEKMKGQPVALMTKDKSAVELYYGMELQYQIFLQLLVSLEEDLLEQGRQFIAIIKKEYNQE